ncbi:MAG: hypothetical protein ACJAS1_000786 [Oleiphilaceae bacterium]
MAVRRLKKEQYGTAQETLFHDPVYDFFCYVTTERHTPWQMLTNAMEKERPARRGWIGAAE